MTTLRDPSDRLLSAYSFFGLEADKKQESDPGIAPFATWIKNNQRRTKNYKPGDRMGMRANTAQYNHIVWRFSGGRLGSPRPAISQEKEWRGAFEDAIGALCQHDLILPIDLMSKIEGNAALVDLLGWSRMEITRRRGVQDDKEGGHNVVTTGKIKNSNARAKFDYAAAPSSLLKK